MAIPPRPAPASATGGANAGLSVSAGGVADIRTREGVRRGYYNDAANNCTYGVGQLAHKGPCSPAELRTLVPAERVRQGVPNRRLTQNQFDALASFAFNVPRSLAATAFQQANAGDDDAVQRTINGAVYLHAHDAHGHARGPAVRNQGLANRRDSEARQYARPS